MNFKEFGNANNKIIVLIHGSFTTWEMWHAQIEAFRQNYFLVVPILNGHDLEIRSEFLSIQQEASEITDYINIKYGTEIFAVIGSSLGGTIALEMLGQNKLSIKKVIIDGGFLAPMKPWLCRLSAGMMAGIMGKIKKGNKFLIKLLTNSLPKDIADTLLRLVTNMSDSSSKNIFLSCYRYEIPNKISTEFTDVAFWYGAKENSFTKKSAKNIASKLPTVKVKKFDNLGHGELITKNADVHIKEVKNFFANDNLKL